MASLLPNNGVILNFADVAPPPSKDYCQIYITTTEVIFRVWKITLRKTSSVNPTEVKNSYQDFLCDDRCQSEISRLFGKVMLDYVIRLVEGHIDYLPRLPKALMKTIIQDLELEDIAHLSQVSKHFQELCRSDDVWHEIYLAHSGTHPPEDLQTLAEAVGWQKLFFTNKLQLQVQLRRVHNKLQKDSSTDDSSVTEDGDSLVSTDGISSGDANVVINGHRHEETKMPQLQEGDGLVSRESTMADRAAFMTDGKGDS